MFNRFAKCQQNPGMRLHATISDMNISDLQANTTSAVVPASVPGEETMGLTLTIPLFLEVWRALQPATKAGNGTGFGLLT